MPTFDDDELGLSIRTKLNNALTKVDGIEDGATDDQTGAEIKALYELEPSAFTDAQFTKLAGIETGATADQTGAEIKALYEAEADTNAFTDADHSKLDGIEAGATADQTDAEIKTAYENNADTNAFTDADESKLDDVMPPFNTVADLLADTNTYSVGTYVHVKDGDFTYKVVASGGDVQNSAGTPVEFEVILSRSYMYDAQAFGLTADGVTDDTTAFQAACTAAARPSNAGKSTVILPVGTILLSDGVPSGLNEISFIGAGAQFTKLQAASWTGGSYVIEFSIDDATVTNGVTLEGFTILGNGQAVGGIHIRRPYDSVSFRDVHVLDIEDAHKCYHLGNLNEVSQTVYMQGCHGRHANTTFTEKTFVGQRLQECQYDLCKFWGGPANGSYTTPPEAVQLTDCRSQVFVMPSFAASSGVVIDQTASGNRGWITFYSPLWENCTDRLNVTGLNASARTYAIRVYDPRFVSPSGGGFTFGAYTSNCSLMAMQSSVAVTLDADSEYNLIELADDSNVTDNSDRSAIISRPNGVDNEYRLSANFALFSANTPRMDWKVEGRSGEWRARWSATSATDNGFQFLNPTGNLTLALDEDGSGNPRIGFFGASGQDKPTITGSRGGNAALADLLTKLETLGLITDSTT